MALPIEATPKLNYKESKIVLDRMLAVDRGEIDSIPKEVKEKIIKGVKYFLKKEVKS